MDLAETLRGYLGKSSAPPPDDLATPLRPMLDPAARTRSVMGSPETQAAVGESLQDIIRSAVEPFQQVGRAISGRSDNPVPEGLLGGLGVATSGIGGLAKGKLATMLAAPLFHGSEKLGLNVLKESIRGPLGPGVYTSPAEQIAGHYAGGAGKIYNLPDKPRDVFLGHGHRSDEEWFGFKNDKQRLIDAAEPDKREAVAKILEPMWSNDGYPAYQRLMHLYKGDEGAQNLFKKAGFHGVSGLVDGPEVLLFGEQSLKDEGLEDILKSAAGNKQ